MKDRVGEIVGRVVEGMPWLGAFHSIGVKSCGVTPRWSG